MVQKNKMPKLFTLFVSFFYIGLISFGGGIIAYVHELAVKNKKWVTEDEFLMLLSISQTMPGLNSVNMSILIGDKLSGFKGSVIASFAMCLPGSIFVLLMGAFYLDSGDHPLVNKFLTGVTIGATALLSLITWRLGQRNFTKILPLVIASATFFLMSVIKLQLYIVILIILPISIYLYRPKPQGNN